MIMILMAILISTAAELLDAHKRWQDVGEIILSPDTSLTGSVPDGEPDKDVDAEGQEDDQLSNSTTSAIQPDNSTQHDELTEGNNIL